MELYLKFNESSNQGFYCKTSSITLEANIKEFAKHWTPFEQLLIPVEFPSSLFKGSLAPPFTSFSA
jgi:hypothetical protein